MKDADWIVGLCLWSMFCVMFGMAIQRNEPKAEIVQATPAAWGPRYFPDCVEAMRACRARARMERVK